MRRSHLSVTALATCLVAGVVSATAPSVTAASGFPKAKHVRCAHVADPPRDPGGPIEIGSTTNRLVVKKMRGFHKRHEGKKMCRFTRKGHHATLRVSLAYRAGTRAKIMKRYMKARNKPGFKLIRLAKGSKVRSTVGKRTVLEYTFRKHRTRRHVRINGDRRVRFAVSSPQRKWKATKRSANKIRRSMKVHSLKAM